jgi:hypothetical protein
MARVDLQSMDYRIGDRATTRAVYPTDDLLEACRRALLAADDARADDLAALLGMEVR